MISITRIWKIFYCEQYWKRYRKMKNLIDSAIENGYSRSKYERMMIPHWDDFFSEAKMKEAYVVGVGAGLQYLLENYATSARIDYLVDNGDMYRNGTAGDYLPYAFETCVDKFPIRSYDSLNYVDSNNAVFLITSTKYRDEIYEQLTSMGFDNCFSLLGMELQNPDRPQHVIPDNERALYCEECNKYEIDNNKIAICCGYYGDHGKSITKELMGETKDIDIVWLVDDMAVEVPQGVRKVYRRNWKKMAYELETAHIWLMDELVPDYIVKREGQIYIQTKHWSSITLKKFYYEDPAYLNDEHAHTIADKNIEMTDYIMVGSDFDEDSCRRGFRFNGPYIRVGSPRSDILFDDSVGTKIRKRYGIDMGVRIILYVPTYRENDNKDNSLLQLQTNFSLWLKAFRDRLGGDWCVMLKLHPATVGRMRHEYETEGIIDVSLGSDCQELVAASDIVVTDYSSVMFEPAFIKEPVFLYAPDKEEYIGGERELLLNYDSLPFSIAESNEQLADNIMNFDQEKYEADVTAFLDRYGVHEDGHASERAAEFILGLLG